MAESADRDIRLVALDVGGVIYYDEPFELAWIWDLFLRQRALPEAMTFAEIVEALVATRLDEHVDPTALSLFGTDLAGACWRRVRAGWSDLAQPMPHAIEAIERLSAHVTLCVAANQPPECRQVLTRWRLAERFIVIGLDSEVGHAKPDPELLRWAIRKSNGRPETTLVVGNRIDHDVIPALALGCSVAFVVADRCWRAPEGVDHTSATYYRNARERLYEVPSGHGRLAVVPDLLQIASSPTMG